MAADPSDEKPQDLDEQEEVTPEETSSEKVEEAPSSDDSEVAERDEKEHSLDDLADEEPPLPAGVEPSRPKSFYMDEEDDTFTNPNRNQTFKSSIPSTGVYTSKNNGGSKKGGLLILLVVALLVIGGSVFLLKSRLGLSNNPTSSPSGAPIASASPSVTPSPSFDRSKYKIRVLNGTKTSGLAASVSAKLVSLGYQSDKVGNATNSAFTTTVINAKSGLSDLVNNLISDLAPQFSATAGGTLPDSDSADAEVILGTH